MNFTAGSCISFGWETFKKRPGFFIGFSALLALAYIVSSMLDDMVGAGQGVVGFAIGILISLVVTTFYLKAHDAPESVQIADAWHPEPFVKFLLATIAFDVIFVVGLILLIVPGFIALLMLFFTTYIVVDKGLGPIDALKESIRITKGHRLELLILLTLCALIGILGFLCLVVGILVAMPVISLAMVHAYRTLQQIAASSPVPVSPAPDAAPVV